MSASDHVTPCEPEDLRRLLGEPTAQVALLDIRELAEFDAGHLRGSSPLPRRTLEMRLGQLVPSPAATIIVYGDEEGDSRARQAAADCSRAGYRDVRWIAGGLGAAAAAGFEVETGTNVPGKRFAEVLRVQRPVPLLSAEDYQARLASGERVLLVDVRMPQEYLEGHVPGARNIPSTELVRWVDELEQADGVVLCCAGRMRGILSAATLQALGIEDAQAFENGTQGWLLAGQSLEPRGEPYTDREGTPPAAVAARCRRVAEEAGVRFAAPSEVRDMVADDGLVCYLFDARRLNEFVAGHIPGAQWMPGLQLVQLIDQLVAVQSAAIVVYDDDEARATMAAYWLRLMGYLETTVLDGGLDHWVEAIGGRLVQGRDLPEPLGLAEAREAVPRVTVAELHAEGSTDQRPVVIDVDTSSRFAAGHVPGARWVPRGWVDCAPDRLPEDPAAPIVLTCERGLISPLAAASLLRSGRADVRYLDGGIEAWKAAGHEMETGGLPPEPGDVLVMPWEQDAAAMRAYLRWSVELAG